MKNVIKLGFAALLLNTAPLLGSESSSGVLSQKAAIRLKTPGNNSMEYALVKESTGENQWNWVPEKGSLPVKIQQVTNPNGNATRMTITLEALDNIYFNFSQFLNTGFQHSDCQFYMPGFWYRRNLRSPKEAPSFHTSESWTVREDRLSTPLTGIFDEKTGQYVSIIRIDKFEHEALTTHKEGEVIVSGQTSLGYTGFVNQDGAACIAVGFPYHEAPKSYIRKLTLAPEVTAFQFLAAGSKITLVWEVNQAQAPDFSKFIENVWRYSYQLLRPQVVNTPNTPEIMKKEISNFFKESYVDNQELKYMSGVHMYTDDCKSTGITEVGFVGRVLLNAFNALEYGEQTNQPELVKNSNAIFDSYLKQGFTSNGFFREVRNFEDNWEETHLSIRRQSEGAYAMLYFLQYEKKHGRSHPEWETKIQNILTQILRLQRPDGSFPRKFTNDLVIIDSSGGSTPSATVPLVLGYKYFKNKKFLASAEKTADYLENEIISKADYFSSTLDANCEDKEASYYASTALYYLAKFTNGKNHERYTQLAHKSAFFALSWYYLWDVPFAQGQMLGDVGLKTRGWGNVSVENNHIDVFIFGFTTVLDWLAAEYNEPDFSEFAKVIKTSMCQLLPKSNQMCNIGKVGYYPEVVQHTNWDYGRNGKGFYNDIFAPGWTVASLWELLTPERIDLFLK